MDLLWLVPAAAGLALLFAMYLTWKILRQPEGNPKMKEIAGYVAEGAAAYLRQQSKVVGLFFLITFFLLYLLARNGYLSIFVPFAFLSGGLLSGLAGFFGMTIATRASSRTANAACISLNAGLRLAFSAGTVMGLIVVGLGLLHITFWWHLLEWHYRINPLSLDTSKIGAITSILLCSGMGASAQALFARVGGGIFTKAADVGADLVGKVEVGIPEDDPRNPAVIADNVGDNVGDVAGMGADLYESYVGSLLATMTLAAAAGLGLVGIVLPLLIAAGGLVASILGSLFIRVKGKETQGALIFALRRGIFTAAFLVSIFSLVILRLVGVENLGLYFSLICGLVAGILIGLSTEFFTSSRYPPTRSISEASTTGAATVIIGGLSVGMQSTSLTVVIVAGAILLSFFFAGGFNNFNLGLYGVGLSSVGLLSTLGIILASDAYGPVADNAGGNAQMSGLALFVRERTDALDSLGNTTAATGKGFAIGSAAMTSLVLIAAYRVKIQDLGSSTLDLGILNPRLLVGMFLGAMLPFLFSSFLMRAVGRSASEIVNEVRRQFRCIPGLIEGKAKAEYGRCVRLATLASQREMLLPAGIAILSPIIVGLCLGLEASIGLLVGALISGFVLAIMMANSGGAWDNAKKFIEEGNLGGKGSSSHKASVVGDTVGDPFKDTAGPSLNILIKLMSMVSIVFASFILKHTLMK